MNFPHYQVLDIIMILLAIVYGYILTGKNNKE